MSCQLRPSKLGQNLGMQREWKSKWIILKLAQAQAQM